MTHMPTFPGPRELLPNQELAGWFAGFDQVPSTHPRRIGLTIMRCGMVLGLASLCLGLAMMHICFAVAVLGAVLAAPPLHRLPGFWLGAATVAWETLSLGVGMAHHETQPTDGLGTLFVWLSLYIAQAAFADGRVRRWASQALVATMCVTATVAILQVVIGLGGGAPLRIAAPPVGVRFAHGAGFLPDPALQGFAMAMAALVFLHLRTVDATTSRERLWGGRTVSWLALLLANVRGAFLGTAVALAVGAATHARSRLRRLLGVGLGLVILVISLLALVVPGWLERLVHRGDVPNGVPDIIAELPLFGAGGFWALEHGAVPAAEGRGGELALAAAYGLPAALLHLAWIGAVLMGAFRQRRANPARWALAASLIAAFLVAGAFEDLARHSASAYAFCLMLGLCLGLGPLPGHDAPAADGRV
jgi:hypothetical protein